MTWCGEREGERRVRGEGGGTRTRKLYFTRTVGSGQNLSKN